MKMRVDGYERHRFKDPYKFWSKVLDTPPKRERKCIATYTYVERIDDANLKFVYDPWAGKKPQDEIELCRLGVGNLWTFTVPKNKVIPAVGNRLQALTLVDVRSNKYGYRLHENHVRIYQTPYWRASWPYEPGIQVLQGKIEGKDRLVDRKRYVADGDKADAIKAKLQKVRELAPIMIRLLQAHSSGKLEDIPTPPAAQVRKELLATFDPDNINAMDAERVFLLGKARCYGRQTVLVRTKTASYPFPNVSWREETDEEYKRRLIVSGLRTIREHIYSKEGVYQYKPVKK